MSKEFYGILTGFIAVLIAIFMMGWAIRGEIANNTAAIAELRGMILTHVNGHGHAAVVAQGKKSETSQ